MTDEQPATETTPPPTGSRRGKRVFILLFVIVVGVMVWHQSRGRMLPGWSSDLPAALAQSQAEDRQVVVVVYDSPKDYDYERLQVVLAKKGNRAAMAKQNVIRVAVQMDMENPFLIKHKINKNAEFPITLLLSAKGEAVTIWTGYIGETDFRGAFLKGKPQR